MEPYTTIATSLFVGISIGICFGWLTKDRASFITKFVGRRHAVNQTAKSDSNEAIQKDGPLVMSDWGDYKMVIVVRQDLGMGKGKAAAQCCHAAVDLYKKSRKHHQEVQLGNTSIQRDFLPAAVFVWLKEWESSGCAKVVLKSPDEDTLIELHAKAFSLGLQSTVISDAGRTQIAPGSRTVLGIGPAPTELIDEVTGRLKLY